MTTRAAAFLQHNLARRRADAHLPPRIHFDGLERHDNTRLTRTVVGTQIGSTVFGTQFLGKRIIRIRHDLRPRSDLQRAVRIGRVEDKERAFRMRLEIFHLLAGAVERQLECRVLVEQKPERCDLRISIRPNGGQHGHIRFEEILVRLRKSGHLCTPTTTNTNRFSIKYNIKRSHSSNNLALPTNGCVAKKDAVFWDSVRNGGYTSISWARNLARSRACNSRLRRYVAL